MKKTLIIITAIFSLYACELTDVLDVSPPNNLVPENVVVNAASAENILNGAYSSFNDRYLYRFTESIPGLLSGSMEVRTVGDRLIESNAILSDNANARGYWLGFYKLVNSANNVIELVGTLPDDEFAGNRKEEIIAEAYFLRGMAHFDLLRYYGQFYDLNSNLGIIIRTEPVDFTERNKGRSSVQDTYDQIISDLDIAISQAPDYTVPYYSSKTSAKALKAKVLLFMGRYAEAADLADEVINEGSVSLSPSFAEVFDDGLNSDEMILMKHADDFSSTNAFTRRKDFAYGFRWLQAGQWLIDFMGSDPRAALTFNTNRSIAKVFNNDTFNPTYYLRLSEIYLIKAEALARSGASLAESKAPLEAVRSRSLGSPQVSAATTIEELLDEIYTEIVLELSFENGSEWFAGIRFNKIIDEKPEVTSADQFILPIPLDEINNNMSLLFSDQNPGYTQ